MLSFWSSSHWLGSCLHSGPNSRSCFSPSFPSGWFLYSSSFPLFLDPAHNESQFSFLEFSPRLCILVTLWSQSVYLVPGLFLRTALPLHLLPFHCLFQPSWPSSCHLLCTRRRIFAQPGQMSSNPLHLSTSATSALSSWNSSKFLLQGIEEVRHFHEGNARSQQKKLLSATWVPVLDWEVRMTYIPRG